MTMVYGFASGSLGTALNLYEGCADELPEEMSDGAVKNSHDIEHTFHSG